VLLPILARVLRDRGIVTERQLQEAIQHQVLYGGRLGTNLYELGFITEKRLTDALGRALGVPAIEIDPSEVKGDVLAAIPKELAAKLKVFPYKLRGKTLTLLMLDPRDHTTVAKLGYSRGFIIKPHVIPEFRMIQLLRDYYGVDDGWRFTDTHRRSIPPVEAPDPATATAQIDTATTRDEVVAGLVALCRRFFKRVVFFIVREPWVLGWTGAGEGMDRAVAGSIRISLDSPSVFRTVTRDKGVFIGRLGAEDEDLKVVKLLGKRPTTNAALFPILVKSRVVNLLYGDNGSEGNVKPDLGELLVQVQKVPRAYLRIIRRRIEETRQAAAEAANPAQDGKESR
jgi:hypothetical protein